MYIPYTIFLQLWASVPYYEISDLQRAPIGIKPVRNCVIVCNCVMIVSVKGSYKCDWLRRIRLYSIDPGASHVKFMCACSKAGIYVLVGITAPWVVPTNVLIYYNLWIVDEVYMVMYRWIHRCTHVNSYPEREYLKDAYETTKPSSSENSGVETFDDAQGSVRCASATVSVAVLVLLVATVAATACPFCRTYKFHTNG